MKAEVPRFVLLAFYPEGWRARQAADVAALCRDGVTEFWVARVAEHVAGLVGLRRQTLDRMGEIHILAVDPAFQRRGIGRALLNFAFDQFRREGFAMVMVETGGDGGHAASRSTYEAAGFVRYLVARYFKEL